MTEYKLVPIEPTNDMLKAIHECEKSDLIFTIKRRSCAHKIYKAMLSAAPPIQPIDVEKLKREVSHKPYIKNPSDVIDHLAASGYLRAPLPRIEGLYDAISIEDLPQPNTDDECDNIVKRYEDHEAIYGCAVSETLLEAARAYAKLQANITKKGE